MALPTEPRFTCDEMLGRLARYLRFLGYDVEYAQGLRDDELVRRSREGDRLLLTRDRILAQRTRRAVLLRSLEVEGQLKELQRGVPELNRGVRFVRCSLCNGLLHEADRSTPKPPKGVPEDRWAAPDPVFVCRSCGQTYWEGDHTREIRRTFARVFGPEDPPAQDGPP
ncbi:protein containing DUF82 [mine drainage metagenome]|uniref:Protein containing DUF82 n=1 Tax=mine drainage metagenome TaxID=410659 RepID=T0ZSY5_9ZZZZ